MLVIISDLHLNDGSAAPQNIPARAFSIWLRDVVALAKQNQAKELVFAYLGDMVDLLRTEYWFYPRPGAPLSALEPETFPLEHRPWGSRDINQHPDQLSDVCRARALQILDKIRDLTKEQLAHLRGDLDGVREDLAALDIPIQRLYVPGNHDRLFWVDPAIRQGILDALGATLVPGDRPFELALPDYGVLARHGHEWDPWNFEACEKDRAPADLNKEMYRLAPIGDPITTELLARLPYEVYHALPPAFPDVVRAQVYQQLKHVEDVRPLDRALRWVVVRPAQLAASYDPAQREAILSTVLTVVKRILGQFMEMPFVKGWLKEHGKWWKFDEADKLRALKIAARFFSIENVSRLLRAAEILGLTKNNKDEAQSVPELGDPPLARYCIHGHTHNFKHVPIGCNSSGAGLVYLNSGTWRPRVEQGRDGRSFVGFKEMTYLVFYREDEDLSADGRKERSYELWNGIMHK
jgi:UDP-2,3-diacylglucosamine pyrophosphatase LpxH